MDDIHAQIAELKNRIAQQEAAFNFWELELGALQQEIEAFELRYHEVVTPLLQRLNRIHEAIEDLRKERHLRSQVRHVRPMESYWSPPPDYEPVEQQFYRIWIEPRLDPRFFEDDDAPAAAAPAFSVPPLDPAARVSEDPAARLKRLYRLLARRYHPDFASDDDDREYRHRLMVMINEAYENADLGALETLAGQMHRPSVDVPLAALELRGLQAISEALALRVGRLQRQHGELLHSEMMALKIDDSLARREGRDLLQEMAADLVIQIEDAEERLEYLRGLGDE